MLPDRVCRVKIERIIIHEINHDILFFVFTFTIS